MNVMQASINDVINNQEFMDIMASIGLTIGQRAEVKDLRYSKIVFLADSDVDGGHINTLLVNFFFTFWPEMFEQGAIQFAKAPLFEVITDKETLFVESEDQLEKLKKSSVKIKEIQRNKGLGEMSPEAFKHTLNREEFTRIQVDDMKSAKHTLDVCFGKDESDSLMNQIKKSDEMDDLFSKTKLMMNEFTSRLEKESKNLAESVKDLKKKIEDKLH